MSPLPLPAQFVGGPEILVIMLVGVIFFFGVPVALLLVGIGVWRSKKSGKEDRIAELERKIEQLEREREGDPAHQNEPEREAEREGNAVEEDDRGRDAERPGRGGGGGPGNHTDSAE